MACYFACRLDHFFDGKTDTISQVENIAFTVVAQIMQGENMGLGKIIDMDVVPDTGAVFCFVIGAENGDRIPLMIWNLQDQRDQMRFGIVGFADAAIRMGTAGVKVAQGNKTQIMCLRGPAKHFFHGKLCFSVTVCWQCAVCF